MSDKRSYEPIAGAAHIVAESVIKEGWEIGSADGVKAYYNGMVESQTWGSHLIQGKYMGEKWQCVEFVRRYYYLVLGYYISGRGDAKTWFKNVPDGSKGFDGLTQYNNGSQAKPAAKDILVMSAGIYGHVAIIQSVSDTSVIIAQQNVGTKFNETLALRLENGKWTIKDSRVSCWLRKE